VIAAGIVIIVAHSIKKMKNGKKTSENKTGSKKPDGKKGGRGNVDSEFLKRVKRLIEIVLPNWTCPEAGILLKLSILLVSRTVLSIWLAEVNG
jgi:hypothetical protein